MFDLTFTVDDKGVATPLTMPGPSAVSFPDNATPLDDLRAAIRAQTKLAIAYEDEQGRRTERVVWPIQLGFMDRARVLAAWCELRKDFRSFRTDRVMNADYLDEKYPERRDILRARWRQSMVWERPKDT